MMNPLRRADLKTSEQDAWEILKSAEYGFLATINPDGTPHCVPIAFAEKEGALYFHCARAGQKLDNLQRDKRAQFTCVARCRVVPEAYTAKYASCMAEGTVHLVADEAERRAGMGALMEKYSKEYCSGPAYERTMRGMPAVVMLRMDITALCGKADRGRL